MKGKGRTILLYFGSIILILAMAMLLPTMSQAQQPVDQQVDQRGERHTHIGIESVHQQARKKVKVPEPSTSALLMIGIGLTGLAGYCLRRRKRGA